MLFRKTIEPRCAYCQKGQTMNETQVACVKKGIVSPDFHCRGFRYDPLKRVPPAPAAPDFSELREEDFKL